MNAEQLFWNITEGYVPTEQEKTFLAEQKSFELSKRNCSDIGAIRYFLNLQKLYLWGNQISDLSALEGLRNLQILNLVDNQIRDISPLAELRNLQTLDLRFNQISDLSALAELRNLQILNLRNNQISDLSALEGLRNLRELNLKGNQISDLSALAEVCNLQKLYLWGNQVSNLKPLARLSNLQKLDLGDNPIHDLSPLSGLNHLCKIDLNHIQTLSEIPSFLVEIELPFYFDIGDFWEADRGICLADSQIAKQPISLFQQPRSVIEDYYRSEERTSVREGKVIFLGYAGVGKTHTVQCFANGGKPIAQPKPTPGVNITSYAQEGKPTIHFWDFGGQEIMHSLHNCFLTERTLYAVVVTNRQSDQLTDATRQAMHWLENIQKFAPQSPVLLLFNRWENVTMGDIDAGRCCKENYPNLVGIVSYQANSTEENAYATLMETIAQEVEKLDTVRTELPSTWARVIQQLRQRQETEDLIPSEDYKQLCTNCDILDTKEQEGLRGWLNDLGVCFSYTNPNQSTALEEYRLLKPTWFTNAVYKLLWNRADEDGIPYTKSGILHYHSLYYILNEGKIGVDATREYRDKKLFYILEIMRKFELSAQVGDFEEFIPALASEQTPELPVKGQRAKLSCRLKYAMDLPDNVVHRLMIRCHKDGCMPEKCWNKGFYLLLPFVDLSVVCDTGSRDNCLHIDIYSNAENAPVYLLLSYLRNHIDQIGASLAKTPLTYTPYILSDDGAELPLRAMLKAFEKGRTVYPVTTSDDELREYPIDQYLGMTYGAEAVRKAMEEDRRQGEAQHLEAKLNAILEQSAFLSALGSDVKDYMDQWGGAIQREIWAAVEATCKKESFSETVLASMGQDAAKNSLKAIALKAVSVIAQPDLLGAVDGLKILLQ